MMGEKQLLIVGVDPGTTVGFAAIDFEGRIIKTHSDKNLDLNILISEVIKLGRPLIVASDKEHNPEFVSKAAIKMGAKMISPDYDLKVDEKRRSVDGFKTKNQHEIDALASAFFAYRKITPLLNKINIFVEHYKKQHIKQGLIELVVGKGLCIKDAVEILEEPKKEEIKIIKEVVEEKKLEEGDFIELFKKYKGAKREIALLKDHNKKLREKADSLKRGYEYMFRQVSKASVDKRMQSLLEFKERRINVLDRQLRFKEDEIKGLQNETTLLLYFLANMNTNLLLKKLDNLGLNEYEKKKGLLGIKEGDILLVKDTDIYSEKTIDLLRGKISVVIYKKPLSKKVENALPFTFIDAGSVDIDENEYFGIVSKEGLEKAKSKKGILDKIISDYKKEVTS